MFLSLHMIFSLERAAVVWATLERISGFDPSLEMIAQRHLKFSTFSSLWPFILISLWKPFGLYVITFVLSLDRSPFCTLWWLYQDASFFFLFCIYDNVICKAEIGNKSSSDADSTWSSNASNMILSRKMLKRVGERRHPCRTPTVVLNHSHVLPLNRTALWDL